MSLLPNLRGFWETKFEQNVEGDVRNEIQPIAAGWEVLVIWECETKDVEGIASRLREFLGPPKVP